MGLYKTGYLASNPIDNVPAPRLQKKILSSITREQLDTIFNYCKFDRDKALVTFLFYSGIRLSEAVNVRAKNFDFEQGTVGILGKGNRYRKALSGNGIVKAWFSEHDSFELGRTGIKTMIQRLSNDSSISFNCHSLRRSFACHCIKSGLSSRVTQLLGGWASLKLVEHLTPKYGYNKQVTC